MTTKLLRKDNDLSCSTIQRKTIIPIKKKGTGVVSIGLSLCVAVYLCLLCLVSPVHADVTTTGDVDPANPMAWKPRTIVYIGKSSNGTLDITNGDDISSGRSYIGYESGSTGEVTVDGVNTDWDTDFGFLCVGHNGIGILNITNGGAVSTRYYYSIIGDNLGSTGVVTVDGAGSRWNSRLYIGRAGNGTLNIINGAGVGNYGHQGEYTYIGDQSGSTGVMTVDGTGSRWVSNKSLYIGNYGNGTLNITNGGEVKNENVYIGYQSGSTGVVTVKGAGAMWKVTDEGDEELYVGYYGNGTLNITNGGEANNEEAYIGYQSGSTGVVTIDGAGSKWIITDDLRGRFCVGFYGNGRLNITNGGEVNNEYTIIGRQPEAIGMVTVDGVGSKWINNTELRVGQSGHGTLHITNGGEVHTRYGSISGMMGVVTVDGFGSVWRSFTLIVSGTGMGKLNITNGGVVHNEFYGYIGRGSDSTGKVIVDGVGSMWVNDSILYIGEGGTGGRAPVVFDGSITDVSSGLISSNSLDISNGGQVSNTDGIIGDNSDGTGVVTVDGDGSTWTNSGKLYVGDEGSGTLNITHGGLVSVSSALTIDDNGDGDSFINMASGGMLALMGDADDSLGQFLDLVDGTDAIRYWECVSGWHNITEATYGEDYTLSLGEGDLAGYTVLTVLAEMTILGDINGDGVVDGFDVDPFVAELLTDGPYNPVADINGDGTVDGFDVDPFVALVIGGDAGAGGAPVPEPMTLVLMVGGIGLVRRRKTI